MLLALILPPFILSIDEFELLFAISDVIVMSPFLTSIVLLSFFIPLVKPFLLVSLIIILPSVTFNSDPSEFAITFAELPELFASRSSSIVTFELPAIAKALASAELLLFVVVILVVLSSDSPSKLITFFVFGVPLA